MPIELPTRKEECSHIYNCKKRVNVNLLLKIENSFKKIRKRILLSYERLFLIWMELLYNNKVP